MNILLSGIVGSTAYGLAHEGSDIDRLGVFAADTINLLGLDIPKETQVTTQPDVTLHEVRKYCALALKCNPTVMELLWLPDELYEVRAPLGDELIDIRSAFLSKDYVRNAYLGYATQQFRKLESRGDGTFGPDLAKRTAKHARHMYRLLTQGLDLWSHGRLPIRLKRPEVTWSFGETVAGGSVAVAEKVLRDYEYFFDNTPTVLPDKPDVATVEKWLHHVRDEFYVPRETSRPRIMGLRETAACLDVCRQMVTRLRRSDPAFPVPLEQSSDRPIWLAEEMEHYAATRNRKPGRKPNVPRETSADDE